MTGKEGKEMRINADADENMKEGAAEIRMEAAPGVRREADHVLRQAVEIWKTPFYLFRTDVLSQQMKRIRDAVGERAEICYAMKANPFLVSALAEEVDSFEVCSPGEFHICERAGIPMEKIVMSGVYKKESDIDYAVKTYGDQGVYTAESPSQWELLRRCAERYGSRLRVLLRLSVGSQFGMDREALKGIVAHREQAGCLHIEGIQLFAGTQKKAAGKFKRELAMLSELCGELKDEYGFEAERVEYGPGLPVGYFEEEEDPGERLLHSLAEQLREFPFRGKIVLEMGRFIAASCGSYVTEIVDVKTNQGQNYCIADGGIHHVNYYGQMMAMKKPPIIHLRAEPEAAAEDQDGELWTVCGSLCTMNDVLVKNYPLRGLKEGDKLVFERTGAYSVTEGISLFLSRPLPQVILYSERKGFRVARGNLPTDGLNWFQSFG